MKHNRTRNHITVATHRVPIKVVWRNPVTREIQIGRYTSRAEYAEALDGRICDLMAEHGKRYTRDQIMIGKPHVIYNGATHGTHATATVPSCARCQARPARYMPNEKTNRAVPVPCERCAPGTEPRERVDREHDTTTDGAHVEIRAWTRRIGGTLYAFTMGTRTDGYANIGVQNLDTAEIIRRYTINRPTTPRKLESCMSHD